MNNIFGQPTHPSSYKEESYSRSTQRTQPSQNVKPKNDECKQLAGTVLRINIPAGAEINVLNLIELTSPSGICLILRLPFLSGECGQENSHC